MTGKVRAVANQKGGVGKTTLAMNLAAGLVRRGSCGVVDADPQGLATMWARVATAPPRFPVEVMPAPAALESRLAGLNGQYDFVVIDCPPAIESSNVTAAILNAQVLLIPVLPSPMDFWASVRIEEMVERVRLRNPGIRAFIVLNQIEARSQETALAEFAVPVLRQRLSRRASYRSAVLEGCSVYELGARGATAAGEIENIIEEVLNP